MIKFVGDLLQVGGFLWVLLSPVADLEGGVRGVRPPKIRKAYVIQR